MTKVESLLEKNKKKFGTKVVHKDSYMAEGKIAYLVDYNVNSSTIEGTKANGSIIIRGIKGDDGLDSFKFILEKS